ncbi:MAG: hypothetical protein MZW92_74605 [Comamonadaceae bacterium]|nr:hypothetical protein [Comamonadaceae bacterium]
MLGGAGFFRGSSILLSGTRGHRQDQSSAAIFAEAACRRGERVLYFSFEESPSQIVRNMRSIGHRPGAAGSSRACCSSTPRGPRSAAWRCTWPACSRQIAALQPARRRRGPDDQLR